MGFIFMIFVICVGGCWAVAKIIGGILFPDRNESGYVDRSVHHHHHHHHHTHQNLTVISDEMHRKALDKNKNARL